MEQLERLFRMGLPEIAFRSRQEAFKWVERITNPESSADAASLARFAADAGRNFFEGPFDPRIAAALGMGAAEHCKDLLAAADKICEGRFDLLGYRDLDFGDPIDWQHDPVAGRRSPRLHWTQIDPLDVAAVGDSKVVWELNRHQWLVVLGQAWRLTREERYAEAATRCLQSWIEANPRGVGINWTSSLEVAFRLISWSWTLCLIRDARALTPQLFETVAASVNGHATHVERYLSYYFSPNTHLTGEALGLLYAGVVFPDLKRARRWRAVASRILTDQIERQVLPDGVYFEHSTCYQRYTIDIYLHFLILAARAGLAVAPIVSARVRSMLDYLVAVRQPDGSMPSMGDADGGLLLPLGKSEPHDYRATFSTAAVVFRSSEYAWAAGVLAPETLWLLGTAASDAFAAIQPAPPAFEPCQVFPDGGLVIMRNAWDETSHALIFDTGPLGCHISSGHGHADLLSIQCSVFGQPYLVDGGTCCYTADPELRDFCRGSAAHSTVVVDGRDHALPAGPFAWHTRSSAQLLRWTSNFAEADHDGYRGMDDPVSHRRSVSFVDSRYWIVIDDLRGDAEHRVEIRFQFAPMQVWIDGDCVRATRDGRRGLIVRAFSSAPLAAEIREGRRNPLDGWISPNYGQLEPAPTLVYSATTRLPLRVVTLLWPVQEISA
jgi:uncharacterized heparinase superfamily protein